MSKKKNRKKLTEFDYHEALDRSYLAGNLVDDFLTGHPVIKNHKVLKKKVETALSLLAEVYQTVGGISFQLFDEKNNKKQ